MTIPTRDDALKALTRIDYETTTLGVLPRFQDLATLRSYIESHTGEPVGYTGSGSLAALAKGADGYIWPSPAAAHPIPLYASPVQPVLEWVGTDGNNLSYKGKVIAGIDYSKNNGGFYVMTWLDEHFRKSLTCAQYGPLEDARAALETAARQWLSIGDK